MMLMTSVAIVLLFLLVIYLTIKRLIFVHQVNKIPGIHSLTGFGIRSLITLYSWTRCTKSLQEALLRADLCANLLNPEGIFLFWKGFVPCIVVSTPEMAEPFLASSVNIKKGFSYRFMEGWLGTGLVTSWGHKWRKHRKLLTPAFHFKILEQFVPIMARNAKILISKLDQEIMKSDDGILNDLSTPILLCALDVICESAMGVRMNAQSDPQAAYVKAIHTLTDIQVARGSYPHLFFDFIFYNSTLGQRYSHELLIAHQFTRSIIKQRKEEMMMTKIGDSKTGGTFLDILMREHLNDASRFTEANIEEEVDTFMFGGHETTSWGVTWTLYLLGLHPQEQTRVQDEIDSLYHDDEDHELTLHDLRSGLHYTEAVLKESHRLITIVPNPTRYTEVEVNVGGGNNKKYTVPAGVELVINIAGIHKDKNHWIDAERFDPQRFLVPHHHHHHHDSRHPYAFIPFSAGPRNCIGQKYAWLEEKAFIAAILRHFSITSLDPMDRVIPTSAIVSKSHDLIRVKLERRLHQ